MITFRRKDDRRWRGSPPIRIVVPELAQGETFARDFENDRLAGRFLPLNRCLVSNASAETLVLNLSNGTRARILPNSDEVVEGGDVFFQSLRLTNEGTGSAAEGSIELNVQREPR